MTLYRCINTPRFDFIKNSPPLPKKKAKKILYPHTIWYSSTYLNNWVTTFVSTPDPFVDVSIRNLKWNKQTNKNFKSPEQKDGYKHKKLD